MSQKSKKSNISNKLKKQDTTTTSFTTAVAKKLSTADVIGNVPPNASNSSGSKRKRSSAKSLKVKDKLPFYQQSLLNYSGYLLAFCATIYLTVSYYLIKLSKALNASDMGAIQFTITMICCLLVAAYYKQNIFGPKESRLLLLCRGLTGSVALTLNFFSIQYMSYGDSTTIRNTSPVVTAIFARVFLKELLNLSHLISLVISLAGILFVARPPFIFGSLLNSSSTKVDGMFFLGFSLAVLSTFAIASAFIFIRKLTSKEIHFSVIIFYLSSIGCAICTFISIILVSTGASHRHWDLEKSYIYRDIGLAVLAGVLNFLGHICFTLALIRESASSISVMRTLDIVLAFLLEFLVVGLIPDLFSFVGASLVIVSISVILVYKIIKTKALKKQKKAEEKSVFRV